MRYEIFERIVAHSPAQPREGPFVQRAEQWADR